MTIPILPLRDKQASVKLAEILLEIESRYGTTSPDVATRKRIAKRTIPAGSDGYLDFDHPLHHAVESAYRESFAYGATVGLRVIVSLSDDVTDKLDRLSDNVTDKHSDLQNTLFCKSESTACINLLLDSLHWDRLYYRNAATKQKTPENLIRQAQYRALYQSLYEAGQCKNVSHLTRWVQAIHAWREAISEGLVAPPFVCEVVR